MAEEPSQSPIGLRGSRQPPWWRAASLLRRLRAPGRATVRHPPLADALVVLFILGSPQTPRRRRSSKRHGLATFGDELDDPAVEPLFADHCLDFVPGNGPPAEAAKDRG